MLKVLSLIGTRPEAIKMAPVVMAFKDESHRCQHYLCVTAQHREMVDQVLDLFGLTSDFDLDTMRPNQSLSELTARLFTGLDSVVKNVKPDWILAQGDTTTVMVASLVAFYHRIKFGHVEAGLRTGDLTKPFPEEANRRIADLVSTAYFAPTTIAKTALLNEGCDPKNILVTGNTVVDALQDMADKAFDWSSSGLPVLDDESPLVLITGHRRESFGEPFREICSAIRELAIERESTTFIYPVHLNPNVQEPVRAILADLDNVHLIQPVDYQCLIQLMKRAALILTDSGGIQEEAPSFRVPVLVMRESTERPEGLSTGLIKLVGTNKELILSASRAILGNGTKKGNQLNGHHNPYGDGKASKRIAEYILDGFITS